MSRDRSHGFGVQFVTVVGHVSFSTKSAQHGTARNALPASPIVVYWEMDDRGDYTVRNLVD
ncbi:MAG: hypothetical protein ACYCUJ_01730 [Acidithiobacillus sp.]